MPAPTPAFERRALVRSIGVTAVLGSIGVAAGVLSGSQMILLDGLYSVVGIVVSWLLLRASALAQEAPTRRFPYGRESVVPLVIGVQGFVLLAMLVYAGVGAVLTVLDGGSEVAAGLAVAYGVLTTVGSVGFWWWLRSVAPGSDVLSAEATGWRVAWARGVGMIVGFTAMGVLADSRFDELVPYIDPAMVVLTCVAFLPAPIGMVRTTILELLESAPPAEVQVAVANAVAVVRERFDLAEPAVYTTKVGPKLYVELEGEADPDVTVRQEHEVRTALREELGALPFDVWLNVELLPRAATREEGGASGGGVPGGH